MPFLKRFIELVKHGSAGSSHFTEQYERGMHAIGGSALLGPEAAAIDLEIFWGDEQTPRSF